MHTFGWRARRAVTFGSIGAMVAFGVEGGFNPPFYWAATARMLTYSLIYGNCLGFAAVFALPRVFGRPRRGTLSWWAMWLAAVPISCLIGGGAAVAILIPIGLMRADRGRILNALFPYMGSALGSVIAVVVVVTTYGYLRARIDAASLALKTRAAEEAEARRVAAEAQLASLESRVRPHFLFNTLNSIAALVHRDPDGAERMTTQLASLMRSSLDHASRPLVRVDEELDLVRSYLEIERVRFGERLRYEIAVPDEVAALTIPRLSIQTLVENAVKYAVSPRRDGARIAVRGVTANGRCRFSVEDDGPGFDSTTLPENHGLALLRARLAMTFGDAASLDVRSTPALTTVSIEVPEAPQPRPAHVST